MNSPDENRLAIWVHQYTGEIYAFRYMDFINLRNPDPSCYKCSRIWYGGFLEGSYLTSWDFWAWADEGVDE